MKKKELAVLPTVVVSKTCALYIHLEEIDLLHHSGRRMELKDALKSLCTGFLNFLDRYSIVVAAVVIYGYYLLTSIDLLQQPNEKRGFLDYFFQFDSVILMWIVAVAIIQLQKYRRDKREQEERHRQIELEFERQKIHLQVLDEITALLQDNVNNPLAIISITTHTIRRRFETDDEIIGWLDRIDTSMQRIHTTINDIKAYQTQKIVERAGVARKLPEPPSKTPAIERG